MKSLLNYVGQIRIYSLLDIVIFGFALSSDLKVIVGIVLLWLSFMFLLEATHKDELRLRIGNMIWLIPFGISLIFVPFWLPFIFISLSFLYAQKKVGYWGILSPLFRGSQNGVIALMFNPAFALIAFLLYTIRNLVGDFRDAGDDKKRIIHTIPVAIGLTNNSRLAFLGHLVLVISTTLFWYSKTNLSLAVIVVVILIQILSYPLTPRISNPKWLREVYGN